MRAFRFQWDAFNDRTVTALASGEGYAPEVQHGGARGFLEDRVKRPDDAFVQRHKDTLAEIWLRGHPGASQIVARIRDAGLGPGGHPRTAQGLVRYATRCGNTVRLRRILLDALLRYGDQDRDGGDVEADSYVPRFTLLDPTRQPPDLRTPHDYQVEAWRHLDLHLRESEQTGVFQGLLTMPTGAGKTFTAVRWLVKNVLSRGMRVLWVAHRHELLRHAAAEFHTATALVEGVDKVRVRVVSGQHCAMTQIDPADHVIVAGIHSLSARADLREELLSDPRLFVVIDEAHHAPAATYRALIRELCRSKPHRILGLTATPTRTIERERPVLSTLFGGRVLYRVELRRLVERGTLARPRLVSVATDVDMEQGITDEDVHHLARYNDLSKAWLARIGELTERNDLIIDHYVENRAKYGKTIVFAVGVAHAALLAEQLRERGVRADYVAHYRPDDTDGDSEALIQSLRDGELEVLVNVQKLTEGVDVPDVQTVFLTRPTKSEILFRQMVGRALRGPHAGGTESAYLVAFDDHWERFRDWEHPFDLVPDLVELSDDDTTEPSRVRHELVELLPWDIIRETARRLRQHYPEQRAEVFEAIPHGWYVLERESEEGSLRHPIPVYEHQLPSWEALLDALWSGDPAPVAASMHFDAWFADCEDPLPALRDIDLTLDHLEQGGERPVFTPLEERRTADPYEIAREIRDADLGERARRGLVEQSYGALARAIYPSLPDFDAAIDQALRHLRFPEESPRRVRAVPVFDPGPEERLAPGPHHDLDRLMAQVLERGGELLEGGLRPVHEGTVEWTRHRVKGWYAHAQWDTATPTGHGRIRVNRLLDSPDVSEATLRFLLWHELVHVLLKDGHTPTFRQLERRWPGAVEAERELGTLNERFGVQYW